MLLFAVIACTAQMPAVVPPSDVVQETSSVTLVSPAGEEISVEVEVAADHAARQRGLMFREHLDDDAGMLFVFEQEQSQSFWMKNTLIPLDILFFDASGNFVSSTTMVPCTADPCASYPSAGPAKYVLEVNEGWVQQNGIAEGWRLKTQH